MDFQNRAGSKFGAQIGSNPANERRERLRKLALETIDLSKDPYFMKNHLGSYECKLCLTIHLNEGSYLSHTQAKKHQANLARRAAKEASMADSSEVTLESLKSSQNAIAPLKPAVIKIGRPGYKVTKIRHATSRQLGLLFQIQYPEIGNVTPRHRFMSAFEQKIEPANKAYQYLIFAAEPYETIAFKISSREIDVEGLDTRLWYLWDSDARVFYLQLFFKNKL